MANHIACNLGKDWLYSYKKVNIMEQHTKKHITAQQSKKIKKSSELVVSNDFISSSEEVFKKMMSGETKSYTEAEMNALMERL